MEILTLLLFAGVFALWISNRDLKRRIDALEEKDGPGLIVTPAAARPPAVAFTTGYTKVPPSAVPPASAAAPPPTAPPAPAAAPRRETLGGLFEQLVAGRLLIWLGGAALVAAAIFLIRYSIEIGLVTPALRMIAAALFGLVLVAAGELASRGRFRSDDPRIAQSLVGAGLAILYAATYGSHVLYGLIGAATASVAMLAVTAAALAMSLRHGVPTALMGLAGGFLTPMLVGDPDAGAIPLIAYLALLDLAIFLIAWRRGWTWLAAAAVALSFVWSAWLLVQPPEDALAAGAFVLLLSVAASLVRPGPGRELGLMQPLAIGIVQLALLASRTDLGPLAWALFGALAAASLVLARLRPGFRFAPALGAGLALALLAAKAAVGDDPLLPAAAIGATLLFGLGGLLLSLPRPSALWAAIAAAGFAGPALIVRAARPEWLERPAWGGLMLALAAGPALLIWLGRGRAGAKAPADFLLLVAGAAAALLGAAAAWDLLPAGLVAAGWLAVALALALAARRLGDIALTTAALVLALVAVARSVWMVPELSAAMVTGLVGDPVIAPDLPTAIAALQALGLPALLLVALRAVVPPLPIGARHALPAVAGLFALACLYIWFKQAFGLADPADFAARGFAERTILTQSLFLAGWALASGKVRIPAIETDLVRLGGTILTALAAVRLIWFDIVAHNPAWSAQWVGAVPLANLVAAEYLLGAFWLYLARRRADQATRSGFWLIAFLAALIAGTVLLVRQLFQGPWLNGPEMPIAEFYAYSLAGLVLSIAVLLAGIRLPDKALRLAGLVLLTATILKVFLVDASELEGVLRILSFLGLGIALIGIGRLYGPVLRAERAAG